MNRDLFEVGNENMLCSPFSPVQRHLNQRNMISMHARFKTIGAMLDFADICASFNVKITHKAFQNEMRRVIELPKRWKERLWIVPKVFSCSRSAVCEEFKHKFACRTQYPDTSTCNSLTNLQNWRGWICHDLHYRPQPTVTTWFVVTFWMDMINGAIGLGNEENRRFARDARGF